MLPSLEFKQQLAGEENEDAPQNSFNLQTHYSNYQKVKSLLMQNTTGQFLPLHSKFRQKSNQRREFINISLGKKEDRLIGLKQSANKKVQDDFYNQCGRARTHTETAIDDYRKTSILTIGSPADCGNLSSLIEHI
jgi:hypothetical protein